MYWCPMSVPVVATGLRLESHPNQISVVIPMRNEEYFVRDKLVSVISEVAGNDNVNVVVVDSGSSDSTSSIASRTFEESVLPPERWSVSDCQPPGKSLAINYALKTTNSDFIIMMDADAICKPGWLKIFMEIFSDTEVGLVCGIQEFDTSNNGKTNETTYKYFSNYRRIQQSEESSIIVAEGSICCFRSDSLRGQFLDEGYNADDTQIALICIRNGYKCKIEPRIEFFEKQRISRRGNFFRRVRRGRGLILAITKNLDLAMPTRNKINPGTFLRTAFFYLLLPWLVIFSIFSLFAITPFSITANQLTIYPQTLFLLLSILLLISRFFRSLLEGCIIMVVAQISIFFLSNQGSWNPIREFPDTSLNHKL